MVIIVVDGGEVTGVYKTDSDSPVAIVIDLDQAELKHNPITLIDAPAPASEMPKKAKKMINQFHLFKELNGGSEL